MNQIQLSHIFYSNPDRITVRNNDKVIYCGDSFSGCIDFSPEPGMNLLTVSLDHKCSENFRFNTITNQVEIDSRTEISEIIVQSRYFRSLLTKCGIVEIDLERNPGFWSKHIITNILTMASSQYSIKFEYPIKAWMQTHLHGRNLAALEPTNQLVKAAANLNQPEK